MPGRNQTGPNGMGPMTGRGMGVRNGMGQGFNSGFGRGRGFGRGNGMGQGFGYGYGYGSQQNPITNDINNAQQTFLENELRIMKDQVAAVERELESINKANTNNSTKEEE